MTRSVSYSVKVMNIIMSTYDAIPLRENIERKREFGGEKSERRYILRERTEKSNA
jgi:hypothetical protein